MKIVSSIKAFLYVSILFFSGSLLAQEEEPLLSEIEESEKIHPIQYFLRQEISLFAAYPYLMKKNHPEFYRASLNYAIGGGDLLESLKPESFRNVQFYSQSRKHLGNWSFQGDFSYKRQLETNRPFLLQSLGNPINPFLLGQEQSGPWSGDGVAINLSGNSARYLGGLAGNFFQVNYQVETSSMDAEPRPLFSRNEYLLKIGQNVQPSNQSEIGISGSFSRSNEENQIGAFAAQEFSLVFMRGLNTFSRNAFQSFTRNQLIEESGFQIYGRHAFSENALVFLQLESGRISSKIRDGIAFPVDGGRVRGNKFSIYSGLLSSINGADYQQQLSFDIVNGTAFDPVFQAVNFLFETHTLEGIHTLNVNRRNMVWELQWSSFYQREEDLAAGSLRNFSNWHFTLSNSFQLVEQNRFSIFLRPGLGLFLPQKSTFPEFSGSINQFMHESSSIFYQNNHIEGRLSSWFLFRLTKEAINMGFDYTYRSQQTREFSTIQLNLSLII